MCSIFFVADEMMTAAFAFSFADCWSSYHEVAGTAKAAAFLPLAPASNEYSISALLERSLYPAFDLSESTAI
jgi:hypothetical protein